MNLIFAGVAFAGGALLLKREPSPVKPRLDIPGVLLVSGAVFCLVYGFSNAASAQLARAVHLGVPRRRRGAAARLRGWMSRAAHPLLPPRVVLDRNRGGAYASMLIASAGLFGIFLFLTYYLQQTLGYSPLVTGVAFLPISAGLILASNLSTIVLMPRFGPKPLVASGMLAAAGAMAWLAQLGPHTGYAAGVLGPIILASVGVGMVIAPVINTGTFGVAPQDAGRRLRHRHRRPATRRLGRHVAAEHHLHRRRHLLPRRAPRRGPAHRPPGPDRAGAGARLRHRVLVDRRHLRRRRGHRRHPAPPRATAPGEHPAPGTRRSDNRTSQGRPRSSGVTP